MNKPLAFSTHSVKLGGWSAERMVNYYPRSFPDGTAAGQVMAVQHAGLTEWVDLFEGTGLTSSPVRCALEFDGDLFAFAGGILWRVKSDGTSNSIVFPIDPVDPQNLVDDAGATMATDGISIGIVAGGVYAVVTPGSGFSATASFPDLPEIVTASSVTCLNHKMIVSGKGSGRDDVIAVSDELDADSFQSAAFGSAEADPDGLVQVLTVGDVLYGLGRKTVEAFYDSASGDWPLAPYRGSVIPHGLLSKRAVAHDGKTIYWVSREGRVFRAQGLQEQEISHPGVAKALSDKNNARCFMQHDGEETFFVVRVPGEPAWCFGLKTQRWSERATGADMGAYLGRCSERMNLAGTSYETQIIGGQDGKLYKLDPTANVDGSDVLKRWIVSQPVMQREFTVDLIQPWMSTGTVDIGRDPKVTLYRSKNGREFTVVGQRSLGAVGDLDREVYWNGLGHFTRRAQFALEVTDPVRADVYGVDMDAR
ncbi:MAG: putative packaged DNA stabilization protein [Prokaryotic dsDNA virus sp.]|nr:MAG: putative packaged DNA stabilization protein [Prokaryotic dsDNA virus sp.]|tara:strand:+ start:11344 stop:12780 length:1437 start_codon:yes stop_codon:yes gene_type:complete